MTMQHKPTQNAPAAQRPASAAAQPLTASTVLRATGDGLLSGEVPIGFEVKGVALQGEIQKDLV